MKRNTLTAAIVIALLSVLYLPFEMQMLADRVKETEPQKLEVTKREEVNPIIVKPEPVKSAQPAKPNKGEVASASIDPVEQNLYEHMVEQDVPESNAREYAKLIVEFSDKYDVDPYIILAMIKVETGNTFNPNRVGKDNDVGLMQVRPATQEYMGIKGNRKNPRVNIEIGCKYLAYNQKRFGHDLGIVAYNQGEGNVSRGTYNTKYLTKVKKALATIAR